MLHEAAQLRMRQKRLAGQPLLRQVGFQHAARPERHEQERVVVSGRVVVEA